MSDKQPMQPIEKDEKGLARFRANKIVRFLLDAGPLDLDKLSLLDWPPGDVEQFYQLIGYNVSSYGGLSFVSAEVAEAADRIAAALTRKTVELSCADIRIEVSGGLIESPAPPTPMVWLGEQMLGYLNANEDTAFVVPLFDDDNEYVITDFVLDDHPDLALYGVGGMGTTVVRGREWAQPSRFGGFSFPSVSPQPSRVIDKFDDGSVSISTIYSPVPLMMNAAGEYQHYETLVQGEGVDERQKYMTEEEALVGHQDHVKAYGDIFKGAGFEGEAECLRLVASRDLTTTDKLVEFKKWQQLDGTKAGLLKLPAVP